MNSIHTSINPEYELSVIVKALNQDQAILAHQLVNELEQRIEEVPASKNLQTRFFIEALKKRISGKDWVVPNLYMVPDNERQIRLFNIMAKEFPFVVTAQEIANLLISQSFHQADAVTILDIGIGTGQQIRSIIENLAASNSLPKKLHVIGIEPSEQSLKKMKMNIQQVAESVGLGFSISSICQPIEKLTSEDWELLRRKIATNCSTLVVNASFSLHHVPYRQRQYVTEQVCSLKPQITTFIEPYAQYVNVNLAQKFSEAWTHYDLTFQALDQLNLEQEDIEDIKKGFFGREIEDVLSESSIEEYEYTESWLNYFSACGYRPVDLERTYQQFQQHQIVSNRGTYIALCVKNYPVVGIGAVTR